LKKYIKSTSIKGVTSTSWAKRNGERRTTEQSHSRHRHNYSTMFTLLLKFKVICEQRWIQFELQNSPSRVFAFDGKIYTTI